MSRYRLYLIFTLLLGAIIIATGFLVTNGIRQRLDQNLTASYGAQEDIVAKGISVELANEISSTQTQLTLMSQAPGVQSGSVADCDAELKSLLTLTGSRLGNLGRVGADGIFKCSLNPALVGIKADTLGPYIDTIFNDPNHAPVMSRSILPPGAASHVVALHVPVYDSKGAFDGTLGGAIYLTDLYKKYLSDVTFAQRGYVVLFDDDGTILYHPTAPSIGNNMHTSTSTNKDLFLDIIAKASQGQSGTVIYSTPTDGEKVAAYEPVHVLPGRTWVVLVTVPVADVRTAFVGVGVDSLLTDLWLLIALVVIAGIGTFVFLTMRLVFKPMREIDQMKSDFVSLVSHQLKTPVAEIKGYVQNMLDGLAGALTPKSKDYLTDMLSVANKNSQLIDDLLNVSRIERNMLKLNPENLDAATLLKDVLEPLFLSAAAKKVQLVSHAPSSTLTIVGDPVKTREALRNIVDNAIKFAPAGSSVTVGARADAGQALFTVEDTGKGIDPDVQTELFKKDRVWAGKVKASGAGLGLYLSKKFIELSGGTITFKTGPSGTTFFIRLRTA